MRWWRERGVCVWGARACVFWRDPVQWFSPVCYCQLLSNLCSCTELHWRWFSRRINAGVFWLTMKLFLMLIVIVILVAASAPDPVIPHWYCCSINRESTWKCMSGRQRQLLVLQSLMLLWPLALSSLHAAPFKISNAATSQWCRSTAAVLPSPPVPHPYPQLHSTPCSSANSFRRRKPPTGRSRWIVLLTAASEILILSSSRCPRFPILILPPSFPSIL